jgi:hypothetical protein
MRQERGWDSYELEYWVISGQAGHNNQTSPPSVLSNGFWGYFPWIKQLRQLAKPPTSSSEVKNEWNCTYTSIYPHVCYWLLLQGGIMQSVPFTVTIF